MAVTHGMNGVLALSIPLSEELLGQIVGFGKSARIGWLTEVHHLIGYEQCLVAPLISFSK